MLIATNPVIPTNAVGRIATYFAVALQRNSIQSRTTRGVHITPDDVVGSFVVLCEPQAAKIWNYFERGSVFVLL
jgi:hypothetical protein